MPVVYIDHFRAERDRRLAQLLADVPPDVTSADESSIAVRLPECASRPLAPRDIEHRRRMLAHLRAARQT